METACSRKNYKHHFPKPQYITVMYIKTKERLYYATRIWHNIPRKGMISFFDMNKDNDTCNKNVDILIDDIKYMSIHILVN